MADEVRTVPDHLDGERVDKVLAELFSLSRSQARTLAERGVTVDGTPSDPADRVSAGQEIRAAEPDLEPPLAPEPVDFEVRYQDPDVLVVDKPAGLVVHPGAGNRKGTLAAGLLFRYPELDEVGPPGRSGLVHRLDKDTSGVLMVARNEQSYENLVRALRARQVERVYLALVEGMMPAPTGTVDAAIGADPAQPTRRAVVHEGKPARTHYRVLQEFRESGLTLLEVSLETGRTHQIRVHLAAISHPVAGDRTYGITRSEIPRTFLHAGRVSFPHPRTGDRTSVVSPLPPDLADVLRAVGGH